jgi:hypothetical protein
MQTASAKKILGSLIEGCDPQSGEPLPAECVVHRSEVLRAFIAGATAIGQLEARAQRRSQLPDNVGKAWTTDEEARLVAAFKHGDSPSVLAQTLGRTLRAIEARLQKLGLITEAERTTHGGFIGWG